jgi:hypothetical protein
MSEEAKPRKVLSLKKKVTEESPPATSSSRPTLGLNRSRPASSWSPPASRSFRSPALQPARPVKVVETRKDVAGKIEVTLKLNQLPNWVYRGKNDEHKFFVNGGGYLFEVRCRPRTWQKLLQAQQDYPAWTAAITGQLGVRIKQGFRLMNASVQIYESKVKTPQPTD